MKALIIVNNQAGSHAVDTLPDAINTSLASLSPKVSERVILVIIAERDELYAAIRKHLHEIDRVIAAGGDGTIIEVISAIQEIEPSLKLGILPLGTGNRLASNLGIPMHLQGALDTALEGRVHRIDIGTINGRYFALMAGAGLDADIMNSVKPAEKRTLGIWAYIWKGIHRAFRVPYTVFDITVDGQHIRTRGIGVVVANAGNLLGDYFTLTPDAQPDDGLLDVCVLASRHRSDYWSTIINVLTRQASNVQDEGIQHLRGQNITIRSRPAVIAQADGDVIGETPLYIKALPDAVAVLLPRNPGNTLVNSIHALSDRLQFLFRDLFGKRKS